MKFLIFVAVVLVAVIVLLLIRKYSSLEFVSHAKLLFKAWSIWLGSTAAMLGAAIQSFPDAAIQAWNMLPPDAKGYIPANILSFVSPALMVMAILAQYVRQKPLAERAEKLRTRP